MFSKTELKNFRVDFASAVKDLEKKYGLKIELGTISYNEVDFKTRLTATKLGTDGRKQVNASDIMFAKDLLGFKGNIGDTYKQKGLVYTIVDVDTKKPKFPIILERSDGKRFKTTVASANMSLLLSEK